MQQHWARMGSIVFIQRAAPKPKRLVIARTKLTEQRIADLPKPGQGASYTYDSLTPSLAIRITAAGVRSFVVVKKINGKTQRITLGRFPGLRLDEAPAGRAADCW